MISGNKIKFILFSILIWQFSFAQNENLLPQEEINSLLQLSDSLLTSYPDQSLTFAEQAFQLSEDHEYENGQLQAMIQYYFHKSVQPLRTSNSRRNGSQ